jgi:bifunctional non-homologous end joining protein LigD
VATRKTATAKTPPAARAEPLAEYVRKRDFAATPEPRGTRRGASKALRFVVQKHRATRLHYDFRLEAGGVLASWAIPKGPSFDPHEKRLAMHVEDHPYEYRTFEGVIPKGNYGAGEVIVWDEGTYKLAEGTDPVAEIANGKIKFVMNGKKLHGMFSLVKIKPRAGEHGEPWLLIKDRDEYVDPSYDPEEHPESARTGKTLAQIAGDTKAKTWKSDRPAANAAPKQRRPAKADPFPENVTPELATTIDEPFDDPDWLFEVKWDGYRGIAALQKDRVTLTSRNGLDLLARFPELRDLPEAFRSLPVLVDGEVCVIDERGHSAFQALQSRERDDPGLTFVAFDLLYADGRDLRDLPLEERKAHLEKLVRPGGHVLYSKHVLRGGKAFFELAQREGLEGIIGKRRQSPYRSTRSRDWVKIKAFNEQEFVIGGWTEPRGSRSQFGALLLGVYEKGKLVYTGHVGTGFDQKKLREIGKLLRDRETKESPFAVTPKTNTRAHFVRPELVAQIGFGEWTRDGILRHPVFYGLREDKDPKKVTRAP